MRGRVREGGEPQTPNSRLPPSPALPHKGGESTLRDAARGAYPISGAAAKALDGLIDDLDKEDLENWQSNFETWAAAAKRCRETIIDAAGAELGQHRS